MIHPNQKFEIQEKQRLSQLYGTHVNRVATSILRNNKRNKLVFTADSIRSKDNNANNHNTQFSSTPMVYKAIRKFSKSALACQRDSSKPLIRLSTPKFKVSKKENTRQVHKLKFCTDRPWFLGYQMNSISSLPPGSPAVLASRYELDFYIEYNYILITLKKIENYND